MAQSLTHLVLLSSTTKKAQSWNWDASYYSTTWGWVVWKLFSPITRFWGYLLDVMTSCPHFLTTNNLFMDCLCNFIKMIIITSICNKIKCPALQVAQVKMGKCLEAEYLNGNNYCFGHFLVQLESPLYFLSGSRCLFSIVVEQGVFMRW